MRITIDTAAGFCPGVQRAIKKSEVELEKDREFFSLGSLLHNELEMGRLEAKGLLLRNNNDLPDLRGKKALIRAHGEPPGTYSEAEKYGVELIDATCGVVKRLQKKIKIASEEMQPIDGQIVIFGRDDHPEVLGLVGHAGGLDIVISREEELSRIDVSRPVRMFSQTTMDADMYEHLYGQLKSRMQDSAQNPNFIKYNTICHHVTKRIPSLKKFAAQSEVIIFVSGRESSNGKKLFSICKGENTSSYFIAEIEELRKEWFEETSTVGISGAASTPLWLMKDVAKKIKQII